MVRRAAKEPSTAMAVMVLIVVISAGTAVGIVAKRGQELKGYRAEKEKGPVALDFSLVSVDGKRLNLSDYRGRPVVVDLMATWCGVCREEMPMLNDTYNKYKDRVVFLSIDVDWVETDEALRAFRDQYKVDWTFALDRTGAAYGAFYPEGYPTLVILDKDGRIVFTHEGAISQADLDGAIKLVA
jgi:thiol-disulfide isomerase/thioredoxin